MVFYTAYINLMQLNDNTNWHENHLHTLLSTDNKAILSEKEKDASYISRKLIQKLMW